MSHLLHGAIKASEEEKKHGIVSQLTILIGIIIFNPNKPGLDVRR